VVIWLLIHLPHLLPPIVAFILLARLGSWAADQPPQQYSDDEVAEWRAERLARRAERNRPVLPSAARSGVIALVFLTAAFGTGLAIYTFNLRSNRPSAPLVWSHTILSLVGLAIVQYKVAKIGWRRLRNSLSWSQPQQAGSSLVLLVLGVPLLVTGVMLLVAPNGHSFTDYFHLIVSVWWTVLLQWHLWRYLGRALGATFGERERAEPRRSASL
jgi:hypothetical protein